MKIKYYIQISVLLAISLFYSGCGSSDGDGDSGGGDGGGGTKYLYISPGTKEIPNKGGSFGISVSANTSWKLKECSSWLSLSVEEGTSTTTVTISFEDNPTTTRTGKVVISGTGVNDATLNISQFDKTFTNPIGGVPDPYIVHDDGKYYLCKADGNGINLSMSTKLSELAGTRRVWTAPADEGSNKPWNSTHLWAPEMHKIDGKWYIYYTAGRPREESGGHYYLQRSGVLRAKTSDPLGAWEDMGMLYTGDNYTEGIEVNFDNTFYAIDLTVFKLNNQLYAVWSGVPLFGDDDQSIYIAKMSDPLTISSNRVKLSRADQPWELRSSNINEGPAVLVRNNKVFIVYSANGSWTKYYNLGMLTMDAGSDPMDPSSWTKSSSTVFTRCDETSTYTGVNGVGHCSFTVSPDLSEDWIVYHAKNRNDNSWETGRSTYIKKFTWNADGTPDFGEPVGYQEKTIVPSGEY